MDILLPVILQKNWNWWVLQNDALCMHHMKEMMYLLTCLQIEIIYAKQ